MFTWPWPWKRATKSPDAGAGRSDEVIARIRELSKDGDRETMDELIVEAVEQFPDHPTIAAFEGYRLMRQHRVDDARDFLESSLKRLGDHGELYGALYRTVKAAPEWQRRDVLMRGMAVLGESPNWLRLSAEAAFVARDYGVASDLFEQVARLRPKLPMPAFQTGRAAERAGDDERARRWFAEARERDARLKHPRGAAQLGVGVFARLLGQRTEAIARYRDELAAGLLDARDLWREIGSVLLDQLRWVEAEHALRQAIELGSQGAEVDADLGAALEGQGRWLEAAEAYEASGSDPESLYRTVVCLAADESWDRAAALLSAHAPEPGTSAQADGDSLPLRAPYWFARAAAARADGRFDDAAQAQARALDRNPDHDPQAYLRLAHDLLAAERHEAAVRAFLHTRIFALAPPDFEKSVSRQVALAARFAEYHERLVTRPDVVIYESFHGASVGCNPLALFDEISGDDRFAGALHVWAIDDEADIPAEWSTRKDVALVPLGSDVYLRHLATAGVLINNSTFPAYFVRRPDQKYLNTWHGTPLKAMGRHNTSDPFSHANTARNFLQATHLTLPNQHTIDVMLDSSDVTELVTARVEETGSPRLDRVVNATAESVRATREALGVFDDRPIVLYAPTWQGTWDERDHSLATATEVLGVLAGLDVHVRFRGHHLVESGLDVDSLPAHAVVPRSVDTYDLLASSAVLVTDYSSLLFDAAVTERPVVLYAPDFEQYGRERGFSVSPDTLGLPIVGDRSALVEACSAALAADGVDPTIPGRFGRREGGRAAKRVVDLLFDDADRQPAAGPPAIVINASFIPNGITTSLLNLTSTLPQDVVRTVVVADLSRLTNYLRRRGEAERLGDAVHLVLRTGAASFRPHEMAALERFKRGGHLDSDEQWDLLVRGFTREFRRVFGDIAFRAAVDFEGYSPWWAAFMAAVPTKQRVIYLHNDMMSEWRTRSPALEQVFVAYSRGYDQLVSVSAPLAELNSKGLAQEFGVPEDLHTHCDNQLDLPGIRERAQETLPPEALEVFDGNVVFIAVGRLSVEKNHALLLDAFRDVHERHRDTRLVIAGDGYLAQGLRDRANDLGIGKAVVFTGQLLNPLPWVARADCFVMSSLHEGQPMAIWEALTLQRPVVSTDLPGIRDMLAPDLGTLVPSGDVAALSAAMSRAVDPGLPGAAFDPAEHVARSRDRFLAVLGISSA